MGSTDAYLKIKNQVNPKLCFIALSCIVFVIMLPISYIFMKHVTWDYSSSYPTFKISDTIEEIRYFESIMTEHDPFDVNFQIWLENKDMHVNPTHDGSRVLCRTRTKPLHCPANSVTECLKISVVGLCGRWATKLRSLPAEISCPGLKNTKVLLDHVDKTKAIQEAHIVLFSFVASYLNLDIWLKLGFYRSPGQMWVLQTEESPIYARGLMMPWFFRNDTYNISNTYHTRADIHSPYGYYEPFRNEKSNPAVNLTKVIEEKKNFIIWISSHCETLQWDRTKLVHDLQRVTKVDIFGKCGNISICGDKWETTCSLNVDKIVRSYKFSLALENSCCEDYVTEKLWHTLSTGTVPIVIGPQIENYKKLAPPGSFIHVDQFDSVESLKDYLEYLDSNDTAYLEYFKWKESGIVREHSIKEHYQNHLSDDVICAIAEQYFKRRSSPTEFKMFDLYGPEWKGTCHHCGNHNWIRNYEHPLDHKRKNKGIWA